MTQRQVQPGDACFHARLGFQPGSRPPCPTPSQSTTPRISRRKDERALSNPPHRPAMHMYHHPPPLAVCRPLLTYLMLAPHSASTSSWDKCWVLIASSDRVDSTQAQRSARTRLLLWLGSRGGVEGCESRPKELREESCVVWCVCIYVQTPTLHRPEDL